MVQIHSEEKTASQLVMSSMSGINEGIVNLQNVCKITMAGNIEKMQQVNLTKASIQNVVLTLMNPFTTEPGTPDEAHQ
jgi:hypothetical protein